MGNNHTPRPWILEEHEGRYEILGTRPVDPEPLSRVVAEVLATDDEALSDAKLIAASPLAYEIADEMIRGDGTAQSHQRVIDLCREYLTAVDGEVGP